MMIVTLSCDKEKIDFFRFLQQSCEPVLFPNIFKDNSNLFVAVSVQTIPFHTMFDTQVEVLYNVKG